MKKFWEESGWFFVTLMILILVGGNCYDIFVQRPKELRSGLMVYHKEVLGMVYSHRDALEELLYYKETQATEINSKFTSLAKKISALDERVRSLEATYSHLSSQ